MKRFRLRAIVGLASMLWVCHSPAASSRVQGPAVLEAVRESPGEQTALRRLLGDSGSGLHVLQAVTRDLDRDGDLDIIASTAEQPLVVWINDGAGHFTRVQPSATPGQLSSAGGVETEQARATQAAVPAPRASYALRSSSVIEHVFCRSIASGCLDSVARSSAPHATRSVRGPPASSLA